MIKLLINRHTVNRNANTGSRDAPISIQRPGEKVAYAHEVRVVGDSILVYRPDKPLRCGARVWIECEEIEVIR